MEKNDRRVQLRLPSELFNKIQGFSEQSRRSINSEIIKRLDESFEKEAGVNENAAEYLSHENKMAEILRKARLLGDTELEALLVVLASMTRR